MVSEVPEGAFLDTEIDPPVRGSFHPASGESRGVIVLTHGAGSNSNAPLLVALANNFAASGLAVLRCDLPYRQARPYGPPRPGEAARDREGLKNAVNLVRGQVQGRVFLGGHSYGGRQATMLCADVPDLVDGLLLCSYPLHPPGKPNQLRTQHFPNLQVPALFIHGTRDPFGSREQMEAAIKLSGGKTALWLVEGAGHDLGYKGKIKSDALPQAILEQFTKFLL